MSDLETPELGGLALLRELKSAGVAAHCPVILIKGDDELQHIVQRRPRCAIGDPAARAKYVRDQNC